MKIRLSTSALCLGWAALAPGGRAQQASPSPATPAAVREADEGPHAGAGAGLRFNFRGAPLETVLNYLSDAAGFVIVLETPVKGTVDMWSAQPVSKEEAVRLLNIALDTHGYCARVQGRELIVSSKDDAKKQNIPVHTGNDPDAIPLTADMVMQIIPLRHIDATQAAKDLGTLMPGSTTLTANQDSNSLVVTDTEMNIHHIVEIVSSLDRSMETVSTTRVFRLKNADPVEMAQLITSLYANSTSSTGNAGAMQGRPGAFFARRFFGGFAGNTNIAGQTGTGTARNTPVVAVADPRTFSIVVSASNDQMPDIAAMVHRLDSSPARKQKAFIITLQNADVQQVQTVLQNLFQSSASRTSTSTQADPLSTRATTNAQPTNAAPVLSLGNNASTGR